MVCWKVFRRVGRKGVKYDIMYGQINVAAKARVLEKFGADAWYCTLIMTHTNVSHHPTPLHMHFRGELQSVTSHG